MLNIEDYINHQNISIWNEIKDEYEFRIECIPKEISWRVTIEDGLVTFITPNKKINIPSFTHELLHVYIENLGMSTAKDLLQSIYGDHSFEVLTQNDLFAKIHNFCSHKKMYPYYKEMGFSENSFLSSRAKLRLLDVFFLKLHSKLDVTKQNAVMDFIGYGVSLYNDIGKQNIQTNEKSLHKLKRIEPSLYRIIENFNQKWEESSDLNLAKIFIEFDKNLDGWLIKQRITIGS